MKALPIIAATMLAFTSPVVFAAQPPAQSTFDALKSL